VNSTQEILDRYNGYLTRNKKLGLYNKNNSNEFWGNIESHYTDLLFLGKYSNKDLSFFDVGCGSGQTLDFAKSLGFHKVSGLEIDKTLYEECLKNGFDVINENVITSKLDFLKNFDIIYFYCFIKEEDLQKKVLKNICNNMKVGAIIKVKLVKFDFENFVEVNRGEYKKIK